MRDITVKHQVTSAWSTQMRDKVQRKQEQTRRASNVMHRTNTADGQVEKRHLEEMCDALEIEFLPSHLEFKDIPVVNAQGISVQWPYRLAIIYHQQGETLDSFKCTLMRYEESFLLMTALLMTVGFGFLILTPKDYGDEIDSDMAATVVEQIYIVTAFASSLCALKGCMVFTGWYLAVSDTPADLVPVVICRYLIEYQTGRCSHNGPWRMLTGGVLPTDLLFTSIVYISIASICVGYLMHGTVGAVLLLLTAMMFWVPIREASFSPYPYGAEAAGSYAKAMQWAIDEGYNLELEPAVMKWQEAFAEVNHDLASRAPSPAGSTGSSRKDHRPPVVHRTESETDVGRSVERRSLVPGAHHGADRRHDSNKPTNARKPSKAVNRKMGFF